MFPSLSLLIRNDVYNFIELFRDRNKGVGFHFLKELIQVVHYFILELLQFLYLFVNLVQTGFPILTSRYWHYSVIDSRLRRLGAFAPLCLFDLCVTWGQLRVELLLKINLLLERWLINVNLFLLILNFKH